MHDLISRTQAIDALLGITAMRNTIPLDSAIFNIKKLPSAQPELKELSEWKADFKGYINALNMPKDDYDGIMEYIDEVPTVQPERKDVLEKAVAVEAISDELMSRFDISATYAYDVAESAVNRIEVRMEKTEKGEQE